MAKRMSVPTYCGTEPEGACVRPGRPDPSVCKANAVIAYEREFDYEGYFFPVLCLDAELPMQT